MYRKKSRGWYKHKDFILIDLACLFMALILAYLIRNGSVRNLFKLGIYRNVMIFVILVDLFLIILFESYKGVLRRGRYQELRSVIRQMILIELASGLYLFTVSGGHTFSRIILYLMGIFYVLLSYCTRIIWKKRLLHKMAEGGEHSLYIVSNYDLASKVIQNVKEHNYNRYNINGLILIDKDMTGKEIAGVPVVADLNNASSFICQQWVDEVFVNVDETYPYPQELIEELLEMGMPVHVNLAKVRSTPGQKQFVEAIGGYTVLTTTMNYATDRQALAKRVLDILGGLVGCFLTGIIFVFIAPAIYISSPGPIFFSQTRIGKNGKPFKMYKFRSMYMDAEERKAELMAQNKMSDGRMFKLDFDPRVIGNKILPDGTRKTGIGEFIRKTSLDEFPQFWNVLNGSMSLVGTRPILQDELRQYELHHRARIAIKPGITGMWQVSGRSDITDLGNLPTFLKRVTIGKLSDTDPELMKPNQNFLKYFPDAELPESKNRTSRSSCLRVGTYFVLRKIIEECSLNDILGKYFGSRDMGLFLDLAVYSIIAENNAAQYYPDYTYNHPLFTEKMKQYSDSTVLDFLNSVTDDQSTGFLNTWNESRNYHEKIYISYDSTNKNCQAGDIKMVEFGHPKVDMSNILKYTVEEYRDCSLEEIMNCIEGDTIQIGTALVEEDMAKTIRGEDTEFHTTDEAPAAFDILFRSLNPKAESYVNISLVLIILQIL